MKPTATDARIRIVCVLFGVGFGLAALSQARTQVIGRDSVLEAARKTSRFERSIAQNARRGVITTSDGRVVAQSVGAWEFSLIYAREESHGGRKQLVNQLPQSPGFFQELAEASGIPEPELAEPMRAGKRNSVWRIPLTDDRADAVAGVRRKWRADGVSLERVLVREYPLAENLSGILGAVRDGNAQLGLERSAQALLAGQSGRAMGIFDRRGDFVPTRRGEERHKRNGADLQLTVDSTLQVEATQAIRAAVELNKAERGAAIVLDPSNGHLLAMANWPSFDPDGPIAEGSEYNLATMAALEPGSTFKILTLALALEAGVIDGSWTTYCRGSMSGGHGFTIHCTKAHGQVNLEKAISVSCNVSAAQWAKLLTHPKMTDSLDKLGLLERPSIGLPGVVAGNYNRKEFAKSLQLATFGYGQSMTASPLALAGAFAMLANQGVMHRPQLLAAIDGKPVPPIHGRQIVKPEVADAVMHMMESVIESDSGTGNKLRVPGFRLAGKTGTAQKVDPKTGRVTKGMYVSNFVGYVPSRRPKALILVMVDNPQGGQYYGASVAGPVFVELAKAVIRRYNLQPGTGGQTPKLGTDGAEVVLAARL